MKRLIFRTVLAAFALTLGFAGSSQAATPSTPPLAAPSGGTLRCLVANLSGKSQDSILIEMWDGNGIVRGTESCGAAAFEVCDLELALSGPGYCRFTAPGGRSRYRASLEARAGGGRPSTVAAVPAD